MPLLVCPNCNVGMTNVLRSEVEFDMCPQCRGVWFDRGELEKLLQSLREAPEPTPPASFLPPGVVATGTASAWSRPDFSAPSTDDAGGRFRDGEYGHHDKQPHDDSHGQPRKGWRGLLDAF